MQPLGAPAPENRDGGKFDYDTAFSRNIGWLTEWEQQELRKKTIAIAGVGGVGGAHALTLARLGIGKFRLADLDRFDVVNLNRQAGAFLSTLDLEKTAVMKRMIRDINPELDVTLFDQGVDEANLDRFLAGADLFVDGLDFFAIAIRRKVFKRCAELGIPAITAAPIGFGAAYLIFMPRGMTFEEYFRLEGLPEEKQYVNFAVGLTPAGLHRSYLVDASRLDLKGHRGPSSAAAIQLCSGVVAAEAVKILLHRGTVRAAPGYHQFDAYRAQWKRGRLRWGNAGPLQALKCRLGYKAFAHLSSSARPSEAETVTSEIDQILELSRWAPSGDNAQPWKFQVKGPDSIIVRIRVEGEQNNIYDYAQGQPTLIAGGFLLQTMRSAATRCGRAMQWNYLGEDKSTSDHVIEVRLPKDPSVKEDPLCRYIRIRSVDRRRYEARHLTGIEKAELEAALGEEFRVEWKQSVADRWRLARLCASATNLRLRTVEAHSVHQRILDWDHRFSRDRVPAASVGVDPLTLKLMRWVLADWRRAKFLNRFLGGTVIPRLELDLVPGLFSAAYFVVRRVAVTQAESDPTELLRAGQAMQRFWLTATQLGLAMQPALAPLCFAHHARGGLAFSEAGLGRRLAARTQACLGELNSIVFLGRIGAPQERIPIARSLRSATAELEQE